MTTFNIFHTTRVRIGVRDAPHIWGAGEIRDAGERRLFGGLARSEPFVTPHVWGTGEMSTEISATYLGRCGNKHWKSRRIYVALGHDELMACCIVFYPCVIIVWLQFGDDAIATNWLMPCVLCKWVRGDKLTERAIDLSRGSSFFNMIQ